MSGSVQEKQPEIRVLPAERAWTHNLARQAGLGVFVLGIVATHWSVAFGLAVAGTVAVTACLMRVASSFQRRRFRRRPDRVLATQSGVTGELRIDGYGVRWSPRKRVAPLDRAWSGIDRVTIRPLTGL